MNSNMFIIMQSFSIKIVFIYGVTYKINLMIVLYMSMKQNVNKNNDYK